MADADERGPLPVAKRRAGGQMTKDDFDAGDDAPSVDPGEWKPADASTLKQRRIIKARRIGAATEPLVATEAAAEAAGGAAPATVAANPFSGISLGGAAAAPVAPNPFASINFTALSKPAEPVKPADDKAAAPAASSRDEPASDQGEDAKASESKAADDKAATAVTEDAGDKKQEDTKPAASGFAGFSFGSGLGGAGFGGFGSLATSGGGFGAFGSTTPAAAGDAEASKPMFSFGTGSSSFASFTAPALGSANGDSAVFGSAAAAEPKPIVQLEEQALVTGEEEERVAFSVSSAKLFEFDMDSKSWKLRGDGEFHLNLDQEGQGRMVMRQRGNLRLILNAKLFPQMTISHMVGNSKAATFACVNAVSVSDAATKAEGDKEGEKAEKDSSKTEEADASQPVLKTWAVSIKSVDKVNELIEVVKQHKGSVPADEQPAGEPQV